MLKMKLMVAMLLSALVLTAGAQEQQNARKPRVLVDKFTKSDQVSEDFCKLVRQSVIDGLHKTERFEMVADDVVNDGIKTDEVRDYIIKGDVLLCSVAEKVKDDKRRQECEMSYSVTIIDVETSNTVGSKTFTHTGGGEDKTPDEARLSSLTLIASDMRSFLISEFPLEGKFVPMDYEVKGNKLAACYIELGTDLGVKKDDFFTAMIPQMRAGRITYRELGKMRVVEVLDGTLSYCKVTNKGRDIFAALSSYLSLDEETRKTYPIKVKSTTPPIIYFK